MIERLAGEALRMMMKCMCSVGMSPKLTSFWRGPFKVIEKCADVTYKIPCGRRGKPQVIHVDRIKAKEQQYYHLKGLRIDREV